MEALKIIRRIAYYLVFLIASTLFFYEMVSLSLVTYKDGWDTFSFSLLFKEVYLPFFYAVISLAVALLTEAFLIGKPKEVETTVYPWTLIIFFGLGLLFSVIIMVLGLIKIPDEPLNKDPSFLILPLVCSILFTLSEVLWGAIYLFKNKKKEQSKQDNNSEKDLTSINLHKEN